MSDNEAVVHVINKISSKDKHLMSLIRSLVLACLRHNILLWACHIRGILNTNADLLSRLKVKEFRLNAPEASPEPDQVLVHLQPGVLFGLEH